MLIVIFGFFFIPDTLFNRFLIAQISINCILPINYFSLPIILWIKLASLSFAPDCVAIKENQNLIQISNHFEENDLRDNYFNQLLNSWNEEYDKRFGHKKLNQTDL